jgi:glycosyltransferase involved in cell wall biosynthesis
MKVSVIVPVYNAERYLEQAVRSVLVQPQTVEVLLIDDGSTDASLSICSALASQDRRVRVLRHADGTNQGAAASRNLGIRSATADFIAFLDADDYMLEGRFEPADARFAEDPSIDGVYDAVGTFLEGETAIEWWSRNRGAEMLTTITASIAPEDLFVDLLTWRHGWFCTDGIVVRQHLIDRTGLFDTALHLAEDSLMWRKMAIVGRLVGGSLDRPVAMRRVHGNNTIIRAENDDMAQNREMLRRLLRWCRARGISESYRHAVIATLVNQTQRTAPRPSVDIWSRAVHAARLLALIPNDPLVLRNAIWRRATREAARRAVG